jgi:hypothetical protein
MVGVAVSGFSPLKEPSFPYLPDSPESLITVYWM